MMVTSLVPISQEASAKQPEKCYKIYLLVNIVKASPYSESDVKKGLKVANKVLKKICVKLAVKKGDFKKLDNNGPDLDIHGVPIPNDGKVGLGELGKWVKAGLEEVKKTKKQKKYGYTPIKLWVVNDTIDMNAPTVPPSINKANGVAFAGIPVIIVTHTENRTITQLGTTIAHELGHKLGLNHTKTDDGDPDNDGESNIMSWYQDLLDKFIKENGTKAVTWSDGQKKIIEDEKILEKEGKKVSSIAYLPPQKKSETQYAALVDDIDDQIIGKGTIFDINQVEIMSDVKYDDVSIYLGLAEPLSTSEEADVVTSVLFDSDGDPTTGMSVEGFEGGYDIEARIEISKNKSKEPLQIVGTLYDWNKSTSEELVFQTKDVSPLQTAFQIEIPKSFLEFSVNPVPILITTRQSTSEVYDSALLEFDREYYTTEPVLTLNTGIIQPDQTLLYTIQGLTPSTGFELFVDDDLVANQTTDSNGDFSGNFVFPKVPDDIYFINAEDFNGTSAFNVINVGPEPDQDDSATQIIVDSVFPESPFEQVKSGISPSDVECKAGRVLVLNNYDLRPACVSPIGADKLEESGWGSRV